MTFSVTLDLMPDDGPPLTSDDVEAAASVGRLPALARQLVFDGAWSSLDVLLRFARDAGLPLGELEETMRALIDGIAGLPPGRRLAASDEVRALERQAAFIIAKRLERDPLTAAERVVLGLAAHIWADLGDLERAARTYERAGDDARAAETYGGLGDLERMEACLERDQQRRRRRQAVADAVRQFEALVAAGERHAALAATQALPVDDLEASGALAEAREVERRLCRGRGVSLRLPGGEVVRLAGTPATIGRDGLCEIVLRDPGVSRRHAVILADGAQGLSLSDAGSRGGTRLGPAALGGQLPLRGDGEVGLGEHSVLRFRVISPALVEVKGTTGLDRTLRAFVSREPLPLSMVVGGAEGLMVRFDGPACRLERTAATSVRVAGRLIGAGCDLLHGDVIDVVESRLRLEVA
jgi:hypothetical protein